MRLHFLPSTLLALGLLATPASAQVTADGTVGTVVTPAGTTFTITGGTTARTNLFHSFSQFSVPTGGTAFFDNTTNIANIFSRVTGGNISNIDGLLRANGTANLFLLNPNGVLFGANSSLQIGGSFLATTADSIVFQDGYEFSATQPDTSPLLTVSVPVGLQFGNTAAPIVNRSQALDSISGDSVGLQVKPGQSISLAGGPIQLANGHLTASGGAIELGSVAPGSFVDINATTQALSYGQVQVFRDIHLTQGAIVSASGEGGGRIQVQGRKITVDEGAAIRTETWGSQAGRDLILRGSERIDLTANSYDPVERTVLSTTTLPGSTGNGGNMLIETPLLQVGDRAWITSDVGGAGNGGSMIIRADVVEAISPATDDFSFISIVAGVWEGATGQGGNFELEAEHVVLSDALVGTFTLGQGDAGDVQVEVESLELLTGSQIQTLTFGDGNAGNMVVRASESINLIGFTSFLLFGEGVGASGLFTSAEPGSTGNGGSLLVETPQLRIAEGGKIAANALGSGNGGDITIRTTNLEVSDPVIDFAGNISGIVASTEASGTGNSGNIHIEAERLRVFDGGQILSSAFGNGQAGDIDILAKDVEVTGISDDGAWVSRIAALSESDLDAGSVTIAAERVNVFNRAEINVSNQGTGNAGNLQISARRLFLDNEGRLRAEVNGGSQGNINLNISDVLLLRRGSSITTNATGASTGGNININAGVIVGVPGENSDISANSASSFGGRITINTNGIFGLKFRPQLTPLSDITASSGLGAAFSGTVDINQLVADPSNGVLELSTALADSSQKIASGCAAALGGNSLVVTGRGGLPPNPSNSVTSDRPWSDFRDLSAFREGEKTEVAQPQVPEQIVEANSWRVGDRGNIELIATGSHPHIPSNTLNCDGTPPKS